MAEIKIGHNSGASFVEDATLSLSDQGYQFQFDCTEKILRALAGFSTINLTDMNGNEITRANYRKRGRDGGLDLIIQIEAATPSAAKGIATRVRKIMADLEL